MIYDVIPTTTSTCPRQSPKAQTHYKGCLSIKMSDEVTVVVAIEPQGTLPFNC